MTSSTDCCLLSRGTDKGSLTFSFGLVEDSFSFSFGLVEDSVSLPLGDGDVLFPFSFGLIEASSLSRGLLGDSLAIQGISRGVVPFSRGVPPCPLSRIVIEGSFVFSLARSIKRGDNAEGVNFGLYGMVFIRVFISANQGCCIKSAADSRISGFFCSSPLIASLHYTERYSEQGTL